MLTRYKWTILGMMALGVAVACAAPRPGGPQHGGRMGTGGPPPMRSHSATEARPVALLPAIVRLNQASESVFQIVGNQRIVRSNAIPAHLVGQFPNRGNPNQISEQNQKFSMPLAPTKTGRLTSVQDTIFGVALNGVVFDPFAAEYWQGDRNSGWNYDAHGGAVALGLDANHAHVQPDGTYHYHGAPEGLVADRSQFGADGLLLIGYAGDGFPIYAGQVKGATQRSSYRLKPGTRPGGNQPSGAYDGAFVEDYQYVAGSGSLDQCNGRMIASDEFPAGTYAYFLTDAFPNVPRCFVGTPDQSFRKGMGRRPRR